MGSVEAIEEEREFDVEETIFVAVGKNVEESKTTLFWAVQNFVGKKICVLHVHQPEHVVEPTDINFSAKRLKQPIREELWEVKHQKQDELLDQYLLLLVQAGVEADKIWIEMNKVEKGIVDTIAAHNIRWLAMGGAAEKHYSEELSELKSKKAFFVCQQAPISCHVWFVCKGRLIYTRGGSKDSVDLEIASPLLLLGSDIENEQLQNSVSESFTNECNADAEGDGNELERISRSLTSQCSVCSSSSTNRVVGTSKLALWLTEEAKALENLCATEMSRRKEIEEALAGEKQEVERMRNQQDKFLKELQMVQDQKSVLEDQLEESQSIVKELEEKIISAVKLLISFKEKRDKLRIENVNAVTELRKLSLDFGFDRLGANGSEIDHPVLITECVCNPVQSRSKMAELLFETYGVPSVAFGVDAAFSYKYNQQLGVCDKEGLAICPGFTTTHVIPFIEGEPVYGGSCRTNIGGYHITDYLKQLISLKYPHHMARFTWEKVEDLKMEHCYIAPDYALEARLFQKGAKEAEDKTRCWQLPWIPPPVEEPPSEEEIARKAAIKEKQGQRLREMAEAKRSSRINELENELHGLEFLLEQLEQVEEDDIPSFLSATGYLSKQEIESALLKVTQSLRKAKGEPKGDQAESEEKTDPSTNEKFPLVNIPDNMLTPEQLKEKRRQLFLKTTSEGRQRAKQKRSESELERERKNQQDEENRLYGEKPELYLEQLRVKYKEISEKVEQRKRLKTNGNHTNGNNMSGSVGRGERLSAAQRERMRLLTTAAFDRGKGEDTFGARDEDWQLYKLMSKDNDDDDDGPDQDEAELTRISSRLQEIDPTFVPSSELGTSQPVEVPRIRPLTKEDFKIVLGVERFRCPEILFHPNWIGVDQAGLDEMAGVSIRRLPSMGQGVEERLTSSIFMTGGSCLFPGIAERLEAGIRMIRPSGSLIKVVRAFDPVLDAWRGAAAYAIDPQFLTQTFSKTDYYEKGEDWLRRYQVKYSL